MKTVLDALHDRRRQLQNPYAFAEELDEIEVRKRDRIRRENPYAYLDELSRVAEPIQRFDSIDVQIQKREETRSRSKSEVEELVRALQLQLWTERMEIFGTVDLDPIDILDPAVALRHYGFDVIESDSLGRSVTGSGIFEVAATIDKSKKLVEISRQFNRDSIQFTLAHELGHALMHETSGLHRDRSIDGSSDIRDPMEVEANRFATSFLMPARQVRRVVEENFGFAPVRVDERALFGGKAPRGASIRRSTARHLAKLTRSNGKDFPSLNQRFRVSVETMAIRLEELGLFVLSGDLPARRP